MQGDLFLDVEVSMREVKSAVLKLLCGLISSIAALLWMGITFISLGKFFEMYADQGGRFAMLVPLIFATTSVFFVAFFAMGIHLARAPYEHPKLVKSCIFLGGCTCLIAYLRHSTQGAF